MKKYFLRFFLFFLLSASLSSCKNEAVSQKTYEKGEGIGEVENTEAVKTSQDGDEIKTTQEEVHTKDENAKNKTGLASFFQSEEKLERYQTQFMDVFDTISMLIGYDSSEEAFQEKADAVHALLSQYHKLFDIYNQYEGLNNLKTVNDFAGREAVPVDAKIIELLEFGKYVYGITDGKVNIACGSVLKIWHEYRDAGLENPETASLPDLEKLEEAARHCNIEDIIIDKEASTVFLRDPDMRLDVGGIGKGFAVQKAGELAESLGSSSFLLNIGGNIKAIGIRGDGKKWVCPVENPEYMDGKSKEAYAVTMDLDGLSLVTSGDYERYYIVDGQRYHHILDPDTLFPGTLHRSVSILMEDSALADALSTGLFLMDVEQGKALLQKLNADREEKSRIEAMWISADGKKTYTDNYLKNSQ